MDYSTKGTSALLPVSWSGDWMRYASLSLSLSLHLFFCLSRQREADKRFSLVTSIDFLRLLFSVCSAVLLVKW